MIDPDDACVRDPSKLCECWVRLANGKDCPLVTNYEVTLHTTRKPMDELYLKGWCDEMSTRFGWDISIDDLRDGCVNKVVSEDELGTTAISVKVIHQ